ncbi:MAG: 50S ribosomal protein L34e [Zestosphaera sp.]
MMGASVRSRSLKRVWRRVPGGNAKTYYRRGKSHVVVCSVCGRELGGIPRSSNVLRKGVRTSKRPERLFGGVLCPSCLSLALKLVVRSS